MITLSSHVLDSVIGDHAAGIRISAEQITATGRVTLFDVISNDEGRIMEEVDLKPNDEVEITFHSAAYWESQNGTPDTAQMMNIVLVRVTVPETVARIHIPVMLAPHSYSVWWS